MATLAELLKTRNAGLADKADEMVREKIRQENALTISESRDGRRGKTVTVISGFTHGDHRIDKLASSLKKTCGVGGTVNRNTIELQGSVTDRAAAALTAAGWAVKPTQPRR